MKNILILGGDGYLGWPTAMHFSARGYNVTVVDNNFRRNMNDSPEVGCLYSVPSLNDRARIWYEKTNYEIKVKICDLTNPESMRSFFKGDIVYDWAKSYEYNGKPDVVIHYAEQPSAPYSMMDYKTSNFTISNNLIVTNNLMYAVRDLSIDTHIIKLGTMGEYGTPNIDIEEGWIDIEHKGRKDTFLFPRQAGSIYHTTKIMDTDLLWFGVRMWGLKVTDLMQGPVYGVETPEIDNDENLRTIFNYDEIFGTVINRFITQAVMGYPLTIYGEGGQTRGYLNINDTLQCIMIAALNPPKKTELRIFNQIVETLSVRDIAEKVIIAGKEIGLDIKLKNIDNPRIEQESHYYNPTHQGLADLGVKPNYFTNDVITKMLKVVSKYKDNINQKLFFKGIRW